MRTIKNNKYLIVADYSEGFHLIDISDFKKTVYVNFYKYAWKVTTVVGNILINS
jgi:hypothetical protein